MTAVIEISAILFYDTVMTEKMLPELNGSVIYFVGIKGTGMTALAELFRKRGAIVTGSDIDDEFYTDEILRELGIPVFKGFDAGNLPESTRMLVHSAAYPAETTPEIIEAKRRGIDVLSYPEALGTLSRESRAAAVAGVHGKTTTAAMAGTLMKEFDFPGTVLTGSAAANFDGRSTWGRGNKYFIAETCEYRRNFLNFSPDYLLITSIEPDHLDYYRDYIDILSAFTEYGERLSEGGRLIYCADDSGASEAAALISKSRPDLSLFPYGSTADGPYRISRADQTAGKQSFYLECFPDVEMRLYVPGRHNILNAAGAAALIDLMVRDEYPGTETAEGISQGLEKFRGTKRRSEIIGETSGILVMDDYGHHPAAIKTTIAGLREFYPDRRIIVDFMSHTYSRTEALLDAFSGAFENADMVILHKIYSSAREGRGTVDGRDLYRLTLEKHGNVKYFEEVMDALDFIAGELRSGDLFVTMGAGDNWKLGRSYFEKASGRRAGEAGCYE